MDDKNRTHFLLRGKAFYALKKYRPAIEDFTKAIQREAGIAAYYFRGLSYHKLSSFDLAIADFSHAIKLQPEEIDLYHARAISYASVHKLDLALYDLDKALEIDPHNSVEHLYKGLFFKSTERFAKAIESINAFLEHKNNPAEDLLSFAYAIRGNSYRRLGNHEKAIVDLDEAIRLNPRNDEAYYQRSLCFLRFADFDAAIADIDRAIELDQTKSKYYTMRAIYTFSSAPERAKTGIDININSEMDRVIQDASQALALSTNEFLVYAVRAEARSFKGEYQAAIHDYSIAIGMAPTEDLAQLHFDRGKTYEKLGQTNQAEADFAKARELGYQGAN